MILDELDVSPDGTKVAFVARPDNRRNYPHTAELYVVDASGKALTRLTDNLAPEAMPRWSPNGKRLAYHAPDDTAYELTKGYLWVMEYPAKQTRKLQSQNMGDIFTLTWSPDSRSLVFGEQQRMNTNVFRLDIESDTLTPLTDSGGSTRALAFSADLGRMVVSYTDFHTPLDIYTSRLNAGSRVRITQANPRLASEIALGKSRAIWWKSSDGLEIEGILTVPPRHVEGERVPLLVLIHGGPPQQWANEFYYDTHLYAGLGYAILAPNVRGSSGYGDDFIKALIGDLGGGEYEDIMSGVDLVIAMGIADPDRLAIRGWSWGGVLSSWAITQTDRFKAASVGAGVMSWLAEMGPGFNTALRDIGKAPVRFIGYPGRGHEEFDPWGQRARYSEEIRWMEKYVNGIDWRPPDSDRARR